MMGEWQPIETAPKDGSVVWVKRVYQRRIVAEGEAVYDIPSAAAPMLVPLGPDPLGRPVDYKREADACRRAALESQWLLPSRLYAFPDPTHWMLARAALAAPEGEG